MTDQEKAADYRAKVHQAAEPLLALINSAAKDGWAININMAGDPVVMQKIDVMKKL